MEQKKKKKRSLRKVRPSFIDSQDEEASEEETGLNLAPASILAARKQKKKDGLVRTSTKTNEGNRIEVGASTHAPPVGISSEGKAGSSVYQSGEDYSAERLKELAQMTSRRPVDRREDIEVRVSGSFKGQGGNGYAREAVSTAFRAVEEVMVEDQSVQPMEEEDDIPDEDAIRAAKQKRERLRSNGGVAVDYIPLVPTDEQGHGVRPSDAPGAVGGDVGSDEDAAAAFEEWSRDQIRKGMSSGFLRESDHVAVQPHSVPQAPANNKFLREDSLDPEAIADRILENIDSQLHRIHLACKQHENGISRAALNLKDIGARIQEDESLLHELNAEFLQAQQMKNYVEALCSLLEEKSPIIEELQDQLLKSRSSRAASKAERHRIRLQELLLCASKGVESAAEVLGRGGLETEARLAADKAVSEAESDLCDGKHIPVELDEFGRDLNIDKRMKIKDRIVSMNGVFAAMDITIQQDGVIGDVSDDESDGEVAEFQQRAQDIMTERRTLFDDSKEEYCDIEAIKKNLESWKHSYAGQYDSTFMGLSAPALFAPFVRLELLSWDPLNPMQPSFTQHHWYTVLFNYGIHAPESDPDHQLIPTLVRSIVLPSIVDMAERVWDPCSVAQSRSLSTIFGDSMVYLDPHDEKIVEMVDVIRKKMMAQVEALHPLSWPPSAMAVTTRAKTSWSILFRKNLNVLKSLVSFWNILPVNVLDSVAFAALGKSIVQLIRAVLLEKNTCMAMVSETANALPKDLLEAKSHYPGLEGFVGELSAILKAISDASPPDDAVAQSSIDALLATFGATK
ncbi:Transcriptional repressor ILP1 [Picochlorum sp. SENEW3]|nr:Transcriptional repressor ILP1 [Picochlorum sp. SENEW3]